MCENDPTIHRVLAAQAVIGLISIGLAWTFRGPVAVLSATLGFLVAAANTGLVALDTRRATMRAAAGDGGALAALYGGILARYALVVVALAAGFGVAGLPAGPAIATFAVAQLAYGLALRFRD